MRVAKYIAHCGVCSRRDAEQLITDGKVLVNNLLVKSPATFISEGDKVIVDGKLLSMPDKVRLWKYYKPVGVVTSNKNQDGRPTVFELLPKNLPRVVSVGRLDINSEGLLLLTNHGPLARYLELPANQIERTYRVRVFGKYNLDKLLEATKGIVIDGISYKPFKLELRSTRGANSWFEITIKEGKNREVRKIFAYFNLVVNRLIRVSYGIITLGKLEPSMIEEIDEDYIGQIPWQEN